MTNRLAAATSPYLQQHADNPVDWWEWGEEAFAEARRRDVPIFLSIGYSACHWCHVMAHESFEDEATAQFLNDNFVSIKVDREERPDVDAIYMDATIALTGHGGWPMSVFLDPDRRPFYAGTYFPPTPRHGMPSFPQLLQGLTDAWGERRDDVTAAAGRIVEGLAAHDSLPSAGQPPTSHDLALAVDAIAGSYDEARGGFGAAPKFPPSMVLEWLLRHSARTGDARALHMVEGTCEAMARGGMYDQLGGGFARYSVDTDWVVPHFEKMLYDNALLLRVYLHWWRLTQTPLALRIVHETAGFLLNEMRTPQGGFAAALDADTDGEEGLYYSWSPAQLTETLGSDAQWAAQLLDVTERGTFEHGSSTLQMRRDPDEARRWESVKARLIAARSLRTYPHRDDKVVAAWNGLAIAALAEAGALLGEDDWIEAAASAADLLITVHLDDRGRLARTSRDGLVGTSGGVLEDYACVADGLQALYSATGEAEWLQFAGELLDAAVHHFADGDGGYFDTPDDGETLIRRPRQGQDNATPAGQFMLAGALLTQSAVTGAVELREAAERALGIVTPLAGRAPRAVAMGLAVAEALIDGPLEVAVVGAPGAAREALAATARCSARPGLVLAVGEPGSSDVPLLAGRPLVNGLPAAYVCRSFACQAPVIDPSALQSQLAQGPESRGD